MQRPIAHFLVAAALAASAAACDSGEAPTTPTTPTPAPTVTETFTGSITVNGAMTFPFSVAGSGTVTAALTTVGPDSGVSVSLSLGTWNGSLCQIVLANDSAIQGTVVTGSVGAAGTLCTRVQDVGKMVQPLTFQITVIHP